FKELIVLNVWLYSLTLLLELAAFVALRLREPALPRPWRVGGGAAGLWLTAALPSAAALLAMATAGWTNTAAGVLAALTGPAAWGWWRASFSPRGARGAICAAAPGICASRRARDGRAAASQSRPRAKAEPPSPNSGPSPPALTQRPLTPRPSTIEPVPASTRSPGR